MGGAEWISRYEKARDAASSVTFATQMQWVNDDQQFSYCAKLVMGLAQLRASVMQADTFQLAVWDGEPTAAIAGTAAHCAEWAELGRPEPCHFGAQGAAATRDCRGQPRSQKRRVGSFVRCCSPISPDSPVWTRTIFSVPGSGDGTDRARCWIAIPSRPAVVTAGATPFLQ